MPMPDVRRIDQRFGRWDELLVLIREAFAEMEGRIDPPSSVLRLTTTVLRLTTTAIAAQAASGAVFVAEEDGALVGSLFAESRGEALYLSKLAVRADRRGRGLARALIEVAAAEARSMGLGALEIETRIELTGNHAAFAAMGFIKTGENAHPGYDRPTSIAMRRIL